ncbi:MAG TPA: hypothetical protein DIU00_18080 [Phycisphaerales bacterium]|nr:hypothetical protein [Phycisphaerales bacterium]
MSFCGMTIRRFLKMKKENLKYVCISYISSFALMLLFSCAVCLTLCGCGGMAGYSNESMFPDEVDSVCLEMFDNRTFRRGVEYELSDALAKRIELDTPYKIISDSDRADTVMDGQIVSISQLSLSTDRDVGSVLEREVELRAVVNWKNLKTGQLMIDHVIVSASASYSRYQKQDFKYASTLAANNLARKIVELMENKW